MSSMGATSAPTKALSLSQALCRTGSFSSIRKSLLLQLVMSSRRVKLPATLLHRCNSRLPSPHFLLQAPHTFHVWMPERASLQRQGEFDLFRESTATDEARVAGLIENREKRLGCIYFPKPCDVANLNRGTIDPAGYLP